MATAGFIDHIGIGVPDLAETKEYYDELMSILGLREWFDTGPGGPSITGPTVLGAHSFSSTKQRHRRPIHVSAQVFIISRSWSRAERSSGKHTSWACRRGAVILDEPQEFPQYGPHCFATYWLDPHGFKLEAVCHTPEES